MVYDRSLTIVVVNDRAREIFELDPADVDVGSPFERLVRSYADRGGYDVELSVDERVAARLEYARRFEPYRDDKVLFDGRTLEAVGRPLDDDHYLLTYTDITRRRRAEDAVRAAYSRYAQLFEATNEGWWFIEPDGTTIDVNPALCAILGRSRAEVVRGTIFDVVDEQNRAVFEDQLERRRQGLVEPYEITLLRPDGSGVTCINSPAPIYDDDGTHVGSIGLWTDVSELKRANRELVAAERRAQEASRAKSEFLSTMSHELRTPLNAILGFAELLEADADDPLTAPQQERVRFITGAGRHLLALITDVLDLARIETGAIDLDLAAVAVGPVVAECVRLVDGIAARREIIVDVRDAGSTTVVADLVRLRQALLNLLSNAVKYNVVGGAVCVEVTSQAGGTVRISIDDTGPGIEPELAARIFEPFDRLGAERGEIEGTGIGLSITKQIVELMGGSIGLESEVGSGSRFWIDLPGA